MTAPHPLLQQLATERRRAGLRQRDAAARAGLSARSISYWETGTRQPAIDGLELYAAALGFRLIAVPLEQPTEDTDEDTDDDLGEQIPFGELVLGNGEKCCSSCRQVRSVRDFHTDRSRRDGLKYRCRFCCNDANRRADHRNRNSGEAAA
jgi:transcriptional regulator with XRE-family HTH domain